ncbi:ABC transporter G family member 6-like [Hibiscus syriacus]|uniref:ABC transporter G family member 6-like n=1 Tax=Hibiscus syriacus TaxID=106335 RepID=UPI0019208AB6|nr:ABC transporter G family member 6-like [Hibiscus syriacus]
MFWQLDDSPAVVQERLGCISISIATIFFNCITEVPTSIQERYIFMRETAYNAYRRSSYFLARSITHIPLLFSLALTLSLITFWAGGVTDFLFFFITILVAFWAGSSFAAFISRLTPDVFLAFVSTIAIVSYFHFLCGFLVARDRLPKYWLCAGEERFIGEHGADLGEEYNDLFPALGRRINWFGVVGIGVGDEER